MKFAFIVQGEGRGHMTQAITLHDMLVKNGHEVIFSFIGVSDRREVPAFFMDRMKCPIHEVKSPNFISDKANKRIRLIPSIIHNAKFLRTYLKEMRKINKAVKNGQPDVLINFYDFLGGFYFRLFKKKAKYVSIAHQFLGAHPNFPYAPGSPIDKLLFKRNNKLMSMQTDKILALSFAPYNPDRIGKIVVVPPLMRDEIRNMKVEKKPYILGYMVNDGYGDDIIKWHENHKEVEMHCFWDRKGVPEEYHPHDNITFHQLNGEKFMEKMRCCQGYVSTAGFESICEAMYMKKPVLMVPVEGQYEQECNALDAEKSGGGIGSKKFDIQKLLDYMPQYKGAPGFSEWAGQSEGIILSELTNFP